MRPSLRRLPLWVSAGSFTSVAALCGWLGYYTMFNSFGEWDDEGYLLSTVSTFTHHGGLYTHIASPFGPFYFETMSTVFSWLAVTHDNGRMVTLAVVLLSSLGFGIAVSLFTRSLLAGVATQGATFMMLIVTFADEATHPSMLVWLVFAIALIALALLAEGRRSIGCLMLGACVAALILTEVNVGALASIAMLFTALTLAPAVSKMRLPRVAVAVLFMATPILLIVAAGGQAATHWAIKYAVIVSCAAAAVVVMTLDHKLRGNIQVRDAYNFLLGGGILGILVFAIALLSGTKPTDFVRGVFLGPAYFASKHTAPLVVPTWEVVWAAICLAGALLYRRYRSRKDAMGVADSLAHIAVGLLMLYVTVGEAEVTPKFVFSNHFVVALPLLFFSAVPRLEATESERIARLALVSLAVLEGLIAYPVAGAQVAWSSMLIVAAGVLCLHDGLHSLHPSPSLARLRSRRAATGLVASVVFLAGFGWLAWIFSNNLSTEKSVYQTNRPFTLAGSRMIRLPVVQTAPLESLSRAIRAQCSTFITFPALNSFYFWTDELSPTGGNGAWFFTMGAPQQHQIVQRIERRDRSRFCVVDNPHWLAFWTQGRALPQRPLLTLVEEFRQEHNPELFGGYRLFVSSGAAS